MKVIIATGGTGGHLFPALLVADVLRQEKHEVFLVGSFSVGRDAITERGFAFTHLNAQGIRFRSPKEAIVSVCRMLKAVIKSLRIVKQYDPAVVLGFGGYGAFPVVLAAQILGYPTIIHEQNAAPGRANVFLGKRADTVAVSFPESAGFFCRHKVVVTGCPCHQITRQESPKAALGFFGFRGKKFTILVFGGSQGSEKINEVFMDTVNSLRQVQDFQIIHVTGEKDFEKIKAGYASLGVESAVYPFLDKMPYAYQVADLVIARAGAVTVAEIISARVMSILIPYPYAYRNHQKLNADILSGKGLAITLEQKDFAPQSLREAVMRIIEKGQTLKNKDELFANIGYTDASEKLAQEAVRLAAQRIGKDKRKG